MYVKDGEDEFQPVSGRLADFHERLWGKREEVGSKIFQSLVVECDDDELGRSSDNDSNSDTEYTSPSQPKAEKALTIMDLGEDFKLLLPNEKVTKLIVREEYEQAKKEMELHRGDRRGGMVVMGMPGIGETSEWSSLRRSYFTPIYDAGKTFFLVYMLVSRLLDKQPTFFQMTPEHNYMFCEKGIFEFRPTIRTFRPLGLMDACNELGLDLKRQDGPVLLIDCNTSLTAIPTYFRREAAEVFIVQAASQAPESIKWFRRLDAKFYDMEPWTRSETVARYAYHFIIRYL